MNFTPEQNAAINDRSPYLLVSAAAGAGKTAVLVERIVSLIVNDRISIDRMLIMTFTNAAARELKQRLSKRLYEESLVNYKVSDQLSRLAFATIGTMHSFGFNLIKQEFALLGLNINVSIAKPDYRQKIYDQSIDDMFEEVYSNTDNDIESFAAAYNEEEIINIIGKIYSKMLAMPDPWEWLNKSASDQISNVDMYNLAYDVVREQIENINVLVEEYRKIPGVEKQFDADYVMLSVLDTKQFPFDKSNLEKYKIKLGRKEVIKGANSDETLKESNAIIYSMREKIKYEIKRLSNNIDLINSYNSNKDLILSHIRAIQKMLLSLHKNFQSRKRAKNVVDYSDMEQMALALLKMDDIKDKINRDYDAIFVDECQDNSAIQDEIIHMLKSQSNMIFMVGDIKQSIYRFRNAEPNLFLEKLNTYSNKENSSNRKILLNKNYRSNPYVIDATNRVFSKVLIPDPMELSYIEGVDWLQAGRTDESGTKVKLRNIFYNANRVKEGESITASYLAEQIKKLIGTPMPNSDRPIEYDDIAILAPQVTDNALGQAIIDTLEEYSIPFFCEKLNALGGFTGIDQIISWLSVLTNSYDDLSLLAILRGPTFNLDDETLAHIRLACPNQDAMFSEAFYYCAHLADDTEDYSSFVDWSSNIQDQRLFTFQQALRHKDDFSLEDDGPLYQLCRDILKLINQERFVVRYIPFDKYIWSFIERSRLYDYYASQVDGDNYISEIEAFCARANNYLNETGASIAEFVEDYKAHGNSKSDDGDINTIPPHHGYVTVGTIHSSKGLEYPIVFIAGLESSIGSKPSSDSTVIAHNEYGIGLKYREPETMFRSSSMIYDAIKAQNEKELRAEKARLLYVAMTRAKESLYLVSAEKITLKVKEKDIPNILEEKMMSKLFEFKDADIVYALKKADSYIDLIRTALSADNDFFMASNSIYYLPDMHNEFMNTNLPVQNFSKDINNKFYEWDIKIALADVEQMEERKQFMPSKLKALTKESLDRINGLVNTIKPEPLDIQISKTNPDYTRIEQVGDRVLLKTTITYVCEVIIKSGEFCVKLPISDNPVNVPKEHVLLYKPNDNRDYSLKPDLERKEKAPDARRLGTLKHYILELADLNRIREIFKAGGREYNMDEGYNNIAKEAQVEDKLHTPVLDDDTIERFKAELKQQKIVSPELQELYNLIDDIAIRMRDSRNINSLEYKALNIYDICAFYINPLGIRMLNSNLVFREHSITLFFKKWDPQVVQGEIDLCFLEDGKWVIVDYKSDMQGMSEKSPQYLQQIALYKLALDRASPFKTKECFIYSISKRKEYRV